MTEDPKADTSHDTLKDMSEAHEEQPGEVLPDDKKGEAKTED